MRMVQQNTPDVQSFLLENKQAILTFLSNYSESSSMARDQSRSMSRSVSPVANGRGSEKSISRSRSRSGSPVVKSNRRGRSSSVDRRRRSVSGSRSPVRRGSRSPVRRGSRSPRRDRRSSRSPRRDTRRNFGRDRSPPRDFHRSRRYRDGRDNPEPCRCIGVFGMSLDTSERDLDRIFAEFGEIETVKVIRDHATGRSRGFGFVYYEQTKDAARAKKAMSDAMIDGMRVRVDYSVTSGKPGGGKGDRGHGGGRSRSRSPIRRRSISHSPRRRSDSR